MIKLVVRDAVLFSILGIVLGFVVDLLFTEPTSEETVPQTIILIFAQAIFCSVIVWFVAKSYENTFGGGADDYFGLTIFTVIFFLVQVQLFTRISDVYQVVLKSRP